MKNLKKCDTADMMSWLRLIIALDNAVIAFNIESYKYDIISFRISDLTKKIDPYTELLLLR